MKTALVVCGFVAAFALAGCDEAQTIDTAEVQKFGEIELVGPMPRAFREFTDRVNPYGALYVTETGGGGGRIGGQPSLEAAKSGALAQCAELNPGSKCVLYATKTPL
ncbi:hypothetical protein [Ruegeria jejuensis]|uniref:hypothetical protein n=1 Tax=Ruegeria jejuensis TaxID=3233338 RepID=UPI00355B809B